VTLRQEFARHRSRYGGACLADQSQSIGDTFVL
jgi:hypothetical protein